MTGVFASTTSSCDEKGQRITIWLIEMSLSTAIDRQRHTIWNEKKSYCNVYWCTNFEFRRFLPQEWTILPLSAKFLKISNQFFNSMIFLKKNQFESIKFFSALNDWAKSIICAHVNWITSRTSLTFGAANNK